MNQFPIFIGILSFCLPPLASAQEFSASTADWQARRLRLSAFDSDGLIHLVGTEDRTFPAVELVQIRREMLPLPERPSPPYLLLTSGETLPLDKTIPLTWKDTRLEGAARGLSVGRPSTPISVPLVYIGMVCLDHPNAEEDAEIVRRKLLESKRKSDVFLLTNGDQIEGKVLQRGARSWKIRIGDRENDLDPSKFALIAINPERLIFPRSKKTYFHAVTTQGVRIDALTLKYDSDRQTFSGRSPAGISFSFSLKDLASLESRQGKSVFVSELFGLRLRPADPLQLGYPLGRNRTILFRPLRLKDGLHDKGLSVAAGDTVQVDLKGSYRWLEGCVGLDMKDGRQGTVQVAVRLDGTSAKLGRTHELSAGDDVLEFRLNVAKVRTVSLVTQPGSRIGVQGIVNWGSLRLVK